jgi:hypothetical protein
MMGRKSGMNVQQIWDGLLRRGYSQKIISLLRNTKQTKSEVEVLMFSHQRCFATRRHCDAVLLSPDLSRLALRLLFTLVALRLLRVTV